MYSCQAQFANGSKAAPGIQTVNRIALYIQYVTTGVVSGMVDFDFTTGITNGTGQYLVTGLFDENSDCNMVNFIPFANAWQTEHPTLVPARVLTASINDDRQGLSGGYVANPYCACLGMAPATAAGEGSTCALNNQAYTWCFVNGTTCADAIPSLQYSGWYSTM